MATKNKNSITKTHKKGRHSLHDRLFKDIFSHQKYSLDLFKLSLKKKEFALFSWNTLRTDITTYVDKHFRELRADLIFSVCLKGSSKRIRIVFLLEHKSRHDPHIMKQLLGYQTEIYAKGGGPVLVIVIYTGKSRKWPGPLRFQDTLALKEEKTLRKHFSKEILDFRYRLLNVRTLKKEDLKSKGLTTRPILYILSEIWDLNEDNVQEFFRLTKGLSRKDKEFLVRAGVTYINKLNKQLSWRVIREAEEQVIRKKEDRVVTLVNQYMEEIKKASLKKGLKKGLLKGLQEGKLKGLQEGKLKGLQEGKLKGLQEGIKQVVLNMLKEEMDLKLISKMTGLSKREINKLKK